MNIDNKGERAEEGLTPKLELFEWTQLALNIFNPLSCIFFQMIIESLFEGI